MISKIYHDKTLFGHCLTKAPQKIWKFSKEKPTNEKLPLHFIELIFRRVFGFLAFSIASLTVFPIGFAVKVLHSAGRTFHSFIFLGASLASLSFAPITLSFTSYEALKDALSPHCPEKVIEQLEEASIPFSFNLSPSIQKESPPLRNPKVENLLEHKLFDSEHLSLYYPKSPYVPHHLAICLNPDVKGISKISGEEELSVLKTIQKVTEVYKKIHISGFVIAKYEVPQEGHSNRCVIEIIPSLEESGDVKNVLAKVGCNQRVLFRSENISPLVCEEAKKEIPEKVTFWKQALAEKTDPLKKEDTKISYPYTRKESHHLEAKELLKRHLAEILANRGASPDLAIPEGPVMMQASEELKEVTASDCPFCKNSVIENQLVFEYKNIQVLYNIRKLAEEGCAFLVIPKAHKERVYNFSEEDVKNLRIVRKALIEVLKEEHPKNEVVIYIQDTPSTGQTVYHSHEQVVSIHKDTVALSWTLMGLGLQEKMTEEEMLRIRERFKSKIAQKMESDF